MRKLSIIVALLLLTLPASAQFKTADTQRRALINLRGVVVAAQVECKPESIKQRFKADHVIDDAMRILKRAGLNLGSLEHLEESPPILNVVLLVTAGRAGDEVLASYVIEIELQEPAFLTRRGGNDIQSIVITWSSNVRGVVNLEDLATLPNLINQQVEAFGRDWQSANPRR